MSDIGADGAPMRLVISSGDVIGESLVEAPCEDCACAVSESPPYFPPTGFAIGATGLYVAPRLRATRLSGSSDALFNPLGAGGVVVVDRASSVLLEHYRSSGSPVPSRAFDTAGMVKLLENSVIGQDRAQLASPSFPQSRTVTAWLHVTNACNLRCDYCYLNKTNEAMTTEVGEAAIDSLLTSAKNGEFRTLKLKYSGGEATMNSALVIHLHDYAVEQSVKYGLSIEGVVLTNGFAVANRFINDLASRRIRVMISLDGIGDAHDSQRRTVGGRRSFKQVDATIGRMIAAGVPPHVSITITQRNASAVSDVVKYCLDRDLTFTLNLFRDNECAGSFNDLQYEESAIIETFRSAFHQIELNLPRWSILGCVLDRGQLVQPRQVACGVARDYVVVDQRGGIAQCHMEIEKTLGDVFSDDPLTVVRTPNGPTLNLLSDERAGCETCDWRYSCSGGCPIATMRATGRFDIKSPNCAIYKAIYPLAIRLEGLRLLRHGLGTC